MPRTWVLAQNPTFKLIYYNPFTLRQWHNVYGLLRSGALHGPTSLLFARQRGEFWAPPLSTTSRYRPFGSLHTLCNDFRPVKRKTTVLQSAEMQKNGPRIRGNKRGTEQDVKKGGPPAYSGGRPINNVRSTKGEGRGRGVYLIPHILILRRGGRGQVSRMLAY